MEMTKSVSKKYYIFWNPFILIECLYYWKFYLYLKIKMEKSNKTTSKIRRYSQKNNNYFNQVSRNQLSSNTPVDDHRMRLEKYINQEINEIGDSR